MKKFTQKINEGILNGNSINGVTNHLTPLSNIVTNVRNFFVHQLPIVVNEFKDGNGLVISSSQFTSQRKIDKILFQSIYRDYNKSSLYSYILSQGLNKVMYKLQGMYWDVYFLPNDIVGSKDPEGGVMSFPMEGFVDGIVENDEIVESFNTTLYSVYEEDETNDEEPNIENIENIEENPSLMKQIKDILNDKDMLKTTQADKIYNLLKDKVEFGDNWKIRAVKDGNENQFIALRHTYPCQKPFQNISELTCSRLAFLNGEENGIFVYDGEHMKNWSPDRKKVVGKIMKLLRMKPSQDNPYIYSLGED